MASSDSSGPGPDENLSRERIAEAIRDSDKRAATAPEIADLAELTNKTVYKHLDDVVADNPDIHQEKIGNLTGYWAESQSDTMAAIGTAAGAGAVSTGSNLPSVSFPLAKLSVLTAGLLGFVTFYGVLWGIPLAAWSVATWLYIYEPDYQNWHPRNWGVSETSWVFIQFVGLQLILAGSVVSRAVLGVGPGIGVAPNLIPGVDVTMWLFLANGGLILGVASAYTLERIRLPAPATREAKA